MEFVALYLLEQIHHHCFDNSSGLYGSFLWSLLFLFGLKKGVFNVEYDRKPEHEREGKRERERERVRHCPQALRARHIMRPCKP